MIEIDVTRQMVGEHAHGDSYRTIGQRHGLSHEAARQVVLREATKFVDSVECDLYLAAKWEAMGRQAEWPTLVVPHQPGDGWSVALSLLQLVVDRLKARDVPVHVQTRPTPDGSVFQLSLGGNS